MLKSVFGWIRFAFVAPWALFTWVLLLLFCVVRMAKFSALKFEDFGVLTSEWTPFVAERFKYSTTLGRMVVYHPKHKESPRIKNHEQIHLDQVEDRMLLSFLVGLACGVACGNPAVWFVVWFSGGIWQVPNFFNAILRYGHLVTYPKDGSFFGRLATFLTDVFMRIAYRDSEHERSAYAQTDIGSDGLSWSDKRDQRRFS